MYHLSTFHLPKTEGVNQRAGEGCIRKTTKKYNKINKISTLTQPNKNLQNAMKVGKVFTVNFNKMTLVLTVKLDRGWGVF